MRIGIDATFIGTSKPTGLAVYTWNMVNHLARIHEDIVLWTADDYGFQLPVESVRHVLQNWAFLGENRYVVRPFWMEACLPKLIKKERVDVLYSTVQGGMNSCPVPHIVTVTDLVPLAFPEDFPWSVRWNYRHRLPKILRKANTIIAISEYTKLDLIEKYGLSPERIKVSYPAYDADHYVPRRDAEVLKQYGLEEDGYILAVGNAYRRKNLEGLIAAFGLIHERVSQNLVLVGPFSSKQKERLLAVAQSHGIADKLFFPGYIPYQDLPLVYSSAALFAYVSLYEGFGIPVLEAMGCGVPVLASSTTSVPEVAGNAAILVNPFEVNEIAGALENLLNNPGLREQLCIDGRIQVKEFNWDRSVQQVLEIIPSIKS